MSKVKTFFKTPLAKQLVVILIPFVLILGFVGHFAVNVPVTDQYAMVPLFQKAESGTLGLGDLWAQQNEHRIFFPRIVLLGLGMLTNWDIRAEIVASLLLSLAGFIALLLIIRRSQLSEPARLLVLGLASLWYFSPVQWENWLWGGQLVWFLCMTATLWAFYFLYITKSEDKISKHLILAAIASIIATYSLGSGAVVWVAGGLVLALRGMHRRQYYFWGITGLASIIVYYIGYHKPDIHPSLFSFLKQPVDFVQAYLAYLGRPVSAEWAAAMLAGLFVALVTALSFYLFYKKQLIRQNAVWVGIAAYVLVAGFITIASRIGFGEIVGLASRYTAFTVLLFIALTLAIIMIATKRGWIMHSNISERSVLIVVGLLAVPVIVGSYYNGFVGMRTRSAEYKKLYVCSRELNPTYECLYGLYFPDLGVAKQRLDYLKQKGYGGY